MIFFDLDGTLVDQLSMRSRALRAVIDDCLPGLDESHVAIQHDRILEEIVSLQASERIDFDDAGVLRFQRLSAALGRPCSWTQAEALYRKYRVEHQRALREVAGASDVLAALRAHRVRLGIISNGYTLEQNGKLEALGWRDMFEVVVVSEAIGAWKPAAAIFEAAARLAGLAPACCLMVGDSVSIDVAGGLAAGFRCVLVAPRTALQLPGHVLHLDGLLPAAATADRLLGLLREMEARPRPGDRRSGDGPTCRDV